MLTVGYKPTDKKKKKIGEGWRARAQSPKREGHPEGRETSNSQECLINTGTISLLIHILCPVWVPRGLHFLLAFQLHTRPQLAVANCNQQVRNVGSPKRNYLQRWEPFWEM